MPTIHDLKQSKYLTKADVTPPILVTVRGWEQVNVAKEGCEPELRYALTFDELDKPMVVNSTNGQIIAAITKAEDFDGWVGHKIVLYNDPNISFGGKLTGGIRCRAPKPQAVPAAKPATPSPAPAKIAPAPAQELTQAESDSDPEVPF